jgi:hypothetical protein
MRRGARFERAGRFCLGGERFEHREWRQADKRSTGWDLSGNACGHPRAVEPAFEGQGAGGDCVGLCGLGEGSGFIEGAFPIGLTTTSFRAFQRVRASSTRTWASPRARAPSQTTTQHSPKYVKRPMTPRNAKGYSPSLSDIAIIANITRAGIQATIPIAITATVARPPQSLRPPLQTRHPR